jgi:hypothetical protein
MLRLHHFCGSTIALSIRETALPALPGFVVPGRGTCSNGLSSFRLFALANS